MTSHTNEFQARESVLAYMGPKEAHHFPPIQLADDVHIKAQAINSEVARLFLCDKDGTPLPIKTMLGTIVSQPMVCELKNMSNDTTVPLHNNEWLISWHANYDLIQGELLILSIYNERFQSFVKYCN